MLASHRSLRNFGRNYFSSYFLASYDPLKDRLPITEIVGKNLPRLQSLPRDAFFSEKEWKIHQYEALSALTVCKVKVIRDQNTTVGYIAYHVIHSSYFGKMAKIEQLAVDSSYRGKGYGSILLKAAIQDLKENDCPDCIKLNYTYSEEVSKLEEFYIKHGFSILKQPFGRESGSMALSLTHPSKKIDRLRQIVLLSKPENPFLPGLFLTIVTICAIRSLTGI